MFFHRLALGHRRHGARCEHHFQLLQVLGVHPHPHTQNLSLNLNYASSDSLKEIKNMFFNCLALGHWRHGARCEHHFKLLQVLGGRHPGLLPRQSGLLPHPVAAPPRYCHLCRKRKDIFVSWSISFWFFGSYYKDAHRVVRWGEGGG
jgi:hypothetical protein